MMRMEEWAGDWRQDLHVAWRQLTRRPGFTLALVITLGLGIGANTTVFSAVDSVLFRELPYADPGTLVTVWQTEPERGIEKDAVSPGNFLEWRDRGVSLTRMSVAEPYSMNLTGQGEPENLPTWLVSEGFFDIMGVPPLIGRTFRPEEHAPGTGENAGLRQPGGRVIVLAHGFWQRRFGGDVGIVGRTLTLNELGYEVIGVMPPGFAWPPGREVWRPRVMSEDEREMRSRNWLRAVARLNPGMGIDEAQADLDRVATQLATEFPESNRGSGVLVQGLREHITGPVRTPLLVLLSAVVFVLLIACTNVAGLLLARGSQRERELAVRAAMGARRGRLVRLLLAEAGLYGLLGAGAGLLLAYWGIRGLDALAAGELPRVENLALDGRVLAFTVALSALTVLLFGLGPALRFSRPDLRSSLKEGGRAPSPGRGRVRARSLLVTGQIALTLVLVAGAGLLTRSFVGLTSVDPGFEVEGRLAVSLHIWDKYESPEERVEYFREAHERITALPGMTAAGAASSVPFGRSSIEMEREFRMADRPEPEPGREPLAFLNYVTPGYLETLGARLLSGRMIDDRDRFDVRPVAVVSAGVADRHWPGDDPIGRSIVIPGEFEDAPIEIVGVVADVRHDRLDAEPWAEIYLAQPQDGFGSMTIVARASGSAAEAVEPVKQVLYAMNPNQTVYSADTLPFSSVRIPGRAPLQPGSPRRLRPRVARSFGRRDLRSGELHNRATEGRDRRQEGSWCRVGRHLRPGAATQPRSRRCRYRGRARGRLRPHPLPAQHAVRRGDCGPSDLRRGGAATRCGGRAGDTNPRAASRRGRPHGGAPRGVGHWSASNDFGPPPLAQGRAGEAALLIRPLRLDDVQLHPPVPGPAFLGFVRRHRVGFTVAHRVEPVLELLQFDTRGEQEITHGLCPPLAQPLVVGLAHPPSQ